MQASRLLSILMLLQSRGRMTAPALAQALEVSTRTILRDIDQLSAAGVPLWGQPGRQGGFQLQAGWSTALTGMTEPEAQALLLAGLPGAAAELGLGGAAVSARLKLLASVPLPLRDLSNRVAQRLHLDPLDWYRAPDEPRFLQEVAHAVWHAQRLRLRYASWTGEAERTLEPLGLVIKAGAWYLVARRAAQTAGRTYRTYRLASIQALRATGEGFERPADFDLPTWWRESAQRFEAELRRLEVRVRVTPRGLGWLRNARLLHAPLPAPPEGQGTELSLAFESEEMAARQLLAFGAELEVLAPEGVRQAVADQARAVGALYARPRRA
ncbi:helix-turn-helix transcriptional regulator [Inhella crocodyli]|uniref:WYL domain-containing protein n=1 Tax=Inhella crocodyli TaxID=2499851 RepID=A0A3S2XRJ8_9BURK|nr:WYL domain-containing protein [Inhella crocodyli]RVT82938.1 WYL domain-containing protein [Inhella crocodyli]